MNITCKQQHTLRRRGRLAFIAAATCLASIASGQTIVNNRVVAQFQTTGNDLGLLSLQNNALGGGQMPFYNSGSLFSGEWAVVLRDRNSYNSILRVDMSTAGISLATPTIFPYAGGQALFASWSGSFSWNPTFNNVPITVNVAWGLAANSDFLDGAISVDIPGITNYPFYISRVEFPRVAMQTYGEPTDHHDLVVPYLSGLLVRDPVGGMRLPSIFQGDDSPLNAPMLGYYNESTRDCLYFGDNDGQRWWKTYEVDNPGYLTFNLRHYPDDIFNKSQFIPPYFVRIGALKGSWETVASAYHDFLTTTSWYKGPVGDAQNPMPAAMKSLVAQSVLQSPNTADCLDGMALDTLQVSRVLGSGVYDMVYNGYYPDLFDSFYFLGYLPGRPSFAGAIRELQKKGKHIGAPYVNGSAAVDWTQVTPPVTPTVEMQALERSSLIRENGAKLLLAFNPSRPMVGMCNGASNVFSNTGWDGPQGVFVQSLTSLASHTGTRAAYLDAYGTLPCYSSGHNHVPGGGNWMWLNRMQQLRDVKAAVALLPNPPPYFSFSMESPHSFATEEIHLSNLFPLEEDAAGFDANTTVTIPLFRAAHDNLKLSKIGGVPAGIGGDRGAWAWATANEVFDFGQIPSVANLLEDYFDSFPLRRDVSYQRFLKRVATFLRGQNFLRYHNGTLEPQPSALLVTPPAGFQGQIPAPPGKLLSFKREYLATGMYRAPGASVDLAFVAANPWVDLNQGSMGIQFTMDPATYGLPAVYSVTKYDNSGIGLQLGQYSGPFQASDQVAPGQIVYWTFQ